LSACGREGIMKIKGKMIRKALNIEEKKEAENDKKRISG
jgi:hypothetical protein